MKRIEPGTLQFTLGGLMAAFVCVWLIASMDRQESGVPSPATHQAQVDSANVESASDAAASPVEKVDASRP